MTSLFAHDFLTPDQSGGQECLIDVRDSGKVCILWQRGCVSGACPESRNGYIRTWEDAKVPPEITAVICQNEGDE